MHLPQQEYYEHIAYLLDNFVCLAVDGSGGGAIKMPDDYGSRQPSEGTFSQPTTFVLAYPHLSDPHLYKSEITFVNMHLMFLHIIFLSHFFLLA